MAGKTATTRRDARTQEASAITILSLRQGAGWLSEGRFGPKRVLPKASDVGRAMPSLGARNAASASSGHTLKTDGTVGGLYQTVG
jgi:hypothetical protein